MKVIISSLFFLLILSGFASAIDKTIYQPRETLIMPLESVLSPISSSQISLLRDGHIETPIEAAALRLGTNYYLYVNLPERRANYTLVVRDMHVTLNGRETTTTLEKPISVDGNISDYTLSPGILYARDTLTLSIILNKDSSTTIDSDLPSSGISLSPGVNQLSFSTQDMPKGFSMIHIGVYEVPTFIEPTSSSQEINDIEIYPLRIQGVILSGERRVFPFRITNMRNNSVNITLSYNASRFSLTPQTITGINSNESIVLNISLLDTNSSFEDNIFINAGGRSYQLPITVSYTQNSSEIQTNYLGKNDTVQQGSYCTELRGKICSASESCSGQEVPALDTNACCLESCIAQESSSSNWIGYLIAAIILVILVIVGGRYLKSRKQTDPFKGKVSNAEKAMQRPI